MNNPYWNVIKDDFPRLLAQLDTNPMSKTYGSFDRSFWHHRRVDFSSASLQQGALVLAQLFCRNFEGTSFYENSEALRLVSASLNYTFSIQHSDGSMDEWYPQERGWAGPTGYVLYAVIRSLELVGDRLEKSLVEKAKIFSERAIKHLLFYEESDVLSNHQAMALLAIESAAKYFSITVAEKSLQARRSAFYENFSEEGWSLEYDGCDPGYQSATLSFMSRLHRVAPNSKLEELCARQLNFLTHFIFPDLSFAGCMGSRGTTNVFHFGFEYWAARGGPAKELADLTLSGIGAGKILRPSDQEDHYLIYRLVEFVECAAVYEPRAIASPWLARYSSAYFSESGLYVLSSEKYYGVLNLKKGGAGKIFQLNPVVAVYEDAGYFFEDSSGDLYTSSFVSGDRKIEALPGNVRVEGNCNFYRRPVFNQTNFLVFRGLLFFIRNSFASLHLKKWIRSKIMTGFAQTSKIRISRTFKFSEKLEITDEINTSGISILRAYRSTCFPSRSVPQSLYTTASQLGVSTGQFLDEAALQSLNSGSGVTLRVV